MRLVIQRVREARVEVDGRCVGSIGAGLLVLAAVAKTDTQADADYLCEKLLGLRIFGEDDPDQYASPLSSNVETYRDTVVVVEPYPQLAHSVSQFHCETYLNFAHRMYQHSWRSILSINNGTVSV